MSRSGYACRRFFSNDTFTPPPHHATLCPGTRSLMSRFQTQFKSSSSPVAVCLSMLFLAVTLVPVSGPAYALEWDPAAPEKRLQFKLAPGVQFLDAAKSQRIVDPDPRFLVALGVQTSLYPFLFELAFLTTIAVDVSATYYAPVLQTSAGVLCLGAGILVREVALNRLDNGQKNMDMASTFGAVATVEWLFPLGWSGLYAEVRQTLLTPAATQVVFGVQASPYLIYLLRE